MGTDAKPRRKLKFSLRSLLVAVTTTAAYFSLWPVTRQKAGPDVGSYVWEHRPLTTLYNGSAFLPLIYRMDENEEDIPATTRRYYLWFFGSVWETPIAYQVEYPGVDRLYVTSAEIAEYERMMMEAMQEYSQADGSTKTADN